MKLKILLQIVKVLPYQLRELGVPEEVIQPSIDNARVCTVVDHQKKYAIIYFVDLKRDKYTNSLQLWFHVETGDFYRKVEETL